MCYKSGLAVRGIDDADLTDDLERAKADALHRLEAMHKHGRQCLQEGKALARQCQFNTAIATFQAGLDIPHGGDCDTVWTELQGELDNATRGRDDIRRRAHTLLQEGRLQMGLERWSAAVKKFADGLDLPHPDDGTVQAQYVTPTQHLPLTDEADRTSSTLPDPIPETEPEPEPEPQPQPEQELKPDPTAPGPRGLVRTSSGARGAAAARQGMQQKAAAQKPLPAGKSKPKAKTKKPKAKSKKGKKALPSSWAADVTAAASWLPGEVYERIGSSVAATEQAAAASSREGLFVHGSAVFGFGKNTFGKNNMLLPKFLYELEAACKA